MPKWETQMKGKYFNCVSTGVSCSLKNLPSTLLKITSLDAPQRSGSCYRKGSNTCLVGI